MSCFSHGVRESTNSSLSLESENLPTAEATINTSSNDDVVETTKELVEMVSNLIFRNIDFSIHVKLAGKKISFISSPLVPEIEKSANSANQWMMEGRNAPFESKSSIKRRRPGYVRRLERRQKQRELKARETEGAGHNNPPVIKVLKSETIDSNKTPCTLVNPQSVTIKSNISANISQQSMNVQGDFTKCKAVQKNLNNNTYK